MPRLNPFYEVEENWLLPHGQQALNTSTASQLETVRNEQELVRQWMLRELIRSYGFPKDWLGERIILTDADQARDREKSTYGICVLTETTFPFLWVSVAAPGASKLAEQNLRSVLQASSTAGLGISTDGTLMGTKFLRRKFDSSKCEYITDIDMYSRPGHAVDDHLHLFAPSARTAIKAVKPLTPLTKRLEDIFFEVHSHIRDIDGLHADEALDELCKILYAKLYDEENTPDGHPYRMQRHIYGSNEEFAATVRSVYHEANEDQASGFDTNISDHRASQGVFGAPIKLSSPALTRVVETLQDYDLSSSDIDVKGRAFQRVLTPAARAGMGQYLTPDPIVRFLVAVTQPCLTDSVLDPFCGSARFLAECFREVSRHSNNGESKLNEFASDKLRGIEKSDRMVRVAMTDMRLSGGELSKIYCTDALLDFSNYPDLDPASFDLILTNPPFGSVLGTEALAHLGAFELAENRRTVSVEVLGLERCLQFLRPGGRLAIVLPDGLLTNPRSGHVREWLQARVKVRAIVSLPIETFAPFGASVKTSVLLVRKWKQGEKEDLDYQVFLARVDNVGYDATGRPSNEAELQEVAASLSAFIREEGW